MSAALDTVPKFGQQDLAQVFLRDDDVGMLGAQAGVVRMFIETIAYIPDKAQ